MRRIDQLPPGPTRLAEQIADLRRQVRELAAARSQPWLPWPFALARTADWPSCTAAAWETVWQATISRVQPAGSITIGHLADASGTTGQVQVTIADAVVQVIDTTTDQQTAVIPVTVPGAARDEVTITIQAQRTAGTGAIRVQVLAAAGLQ